LKTILVISDLHINSTVALCKPSVELDDGQEVKISKGQRWLWNNWQDLLSRADQARPDILIVNGDAVEGDTKNRSYQIITRNKATALGIAADILDPLCKIVGSTYFIRGTGAHSGKSANIEEELAKDMNGVRSKETGAYSHWALNLDVEGVRINIAHHTTMSGIPWGRKKAAMTLSERILFDSAQNEELHPHLAIRGHVHRWADSYDAYPVRSLILPCWSLATEYVHRISPDALAECGAAIIRVSAGKYEIEKINYRPKGRVWQKI
jgi:hypothetical protein